VWGGLGVADFNNDGKLDVVVRADAYLGKGEISIFIQNNASSWSAIKTMYTRSCDGLDVGDLDGDLDADIVLNGFWLENPYPDLSGNWSEHNIDSKWWNQSSGDENNWADNNARVVVVDLNKDGRLDVLLSQPERSGYPISWYETSNPRNGPWVEHVIGYVDYCHTLLVGDINLDGYLDVVAAKFERSDGLYPPPFPIKVYYNSGDSLSWNETVVSDLGIYKGVLGDIANDGYLDIIGSRGYLKPPVEIWVNSLTPTSTPTPTPSPTETPTPTPTPTETPTPTPTPTETPTPTPTPTETPTPTPTPLPSQAPTLAPTTVPSNAAPIVTASPTPHSTAKTTPTPAPTMSAVNATTQTGSNIQLAISGNITCAQMSNITLATNPKAAETTVSFAVTGQSGSTGFGNITVLKSAVPIGATPTIYIDNQKAANQNYAQDANNYYVWYTVHFSAHEIAIVFSAPNVTPALSFELSVTWLTTLFVAVIISLLAVLPVAILFAKRRKTKM
jgi:hypothetical protein